MAQPEWKLGKPVDFTKLSDRQLLEVRRRINDRLVEMGEPRPLLTGVPPKSDEAKDLHSQYGAVMYVLYKRGIKEEDK